MSKGTIKFYNSEKGFGYIYEDLTGKDIYFHIADWKTPSMPYGDDDVEFQTEYGKESKLKAVNIILIKSAKDKKKERALKNDDRVICPSCSKKIVPRLIMRNGSVSHSVCPYCATKVKDFGYCFIATAVYNDYNHPKVMVLRKFRDDYLLTNKFGKKFVEFYYKNSPKFADFIKGKKILAYPIKKVLDGFSYLIENYNNKKQ